MAGAVEGLGQERNRNKQLLSFHLYLFGFSTRSFIDSASGLGFATE